MEDDLGSDANGFDKASDNLFQKISAVDVSEDGKFILVRDYVKTYGDLTLIKIIEQICLISKEEKSLLDLQKTDLSKYQYCRALAFGLVLHREKLSDSLIYILSRVSAARLKSRNSSTLLGDNVVSLAINLIDRDQIFDSFKDPKKLLSAIEGPVLATQEKRLVVILMFVTNRKNLMDYYDSLPKDSKIRSLFS